jgi:Predicted hydrolases of the HAD superfamily
MIFYNGGEIYHNKERIYSRYLSLDTLKSIIDTLLKSHRQCRVCFEINDKLYSNFDIEDFFGSIDFEAIELDTFELKPAAKVLVDLSSIEDIEAFKTSLPRDCHMVITDNGNLGQIAVREVNKLNALNYILHKLGTTLDKVMFFGDDINDMELIKECGIGVAMGNAAEAVKEAADFVTRSNEEDGIAVFLDEFEKRVSV